MKPFSAQMVLQTKPLQPVRGRSGFIENSDVAEKGLHVADGIARIEAQAVCVDWPGRHYQVFPQYLATYGEMQTACARFCNQPTRDLVILA